MRPSIPAIHAHRSGDRAFTLIELILAIAIALILILGVSRVFTYSSQAIGAGQAISEVSRDARAAATVFASDFAQAVVDSSPCIILRSQQVYAFDNQSGFNAARVRTTFTNVANNQPVPDPRYDSQGNFVVPAQYGPQSHRIDTFSFFAQGPFARRTANAPNTGVAQPMTPMMPGFVADQSAPEAWIIYGHLALPDNRLQEMDSSGNGICKYPGQMTGPDNTTGASPTAYNPNNLFASQWILGRNAILLQPSDYNYVIYDRNGVAQDYYCRPPAPQYNSTSNFYTLRGSAGSIPVPPGPPHFKAPIPGGNTRGTVASMAYYPYPSIIPSLYPLDSSTPPALFSQTNWRSLGATAIAAGTFQPLWTSRYDLANTSIAQFRDILKNYIEEQSMQRTAGQYRTIDWWDCLMTTTRFYGNPFIQRPLVLPSVNGTIQPFNAKQPPSATNFDPNKQYAQLAPCFLAGCSQFIVEYAGDFLNQDPTTGAVTNTYIDGPTDGQIDYVLDANGNRQTRWYGLPRSVTTSPTGGILPLKQPSVGGGPVNSTVIQQPNVYPLTDVWSTAFSSTYNAGASTQCAPFEKINIAGFSGYNANLWPPVFLDGATSVSPTAASPTTGNNPVPYFAKRAAGIDYQPVNASAPPGSPALQDGEFYTCAWGPYDRKPAMIRITMTLDDPAGRVAPQTYEFVYKLGSANGN